MRYGIFSDIHGNLEACEQAIRWFKKKRVDKFIFLGDAVGYGANPRETIALLKILPGICIAGNHDYAAAGGMNVNHFNSHAREAIQWTRNVLSDSDKFFLRERPFIYEEETFVCVHGSMRFPEDFNYVLSKEDAAANFNIMQKQICFIGHSHVHEMYIQKEGGIEHAQKRKLAIKKGCRYIINVGSVGQPRDRDNRLSACLYDDKKKIIRIERLKYDIRLAADKIRDAGLPAILAERLSLGR